MKDFLKKFVYLLDPNDRREFVKFSVLLFIGGIISLLGIGVVIPFVTLLVNPNSLLQIKYFKNNHFEYHHLLFFSIFTLIASFWIKNISAFFILKKQVSFLGKLIAKIQKKLYSCYVNSPYIYHIKRNSPELINNINIEMGILYSNVIGQVGTILNEGITLIIISIALIIIHPFFSIIVVGLVFLTAYYFIKLFKHKITSYGNIRSENDINLTKSVLQSLSSIKETKIYQKEKFFMHKVNIYADKLALAGAYQALFQQTSRFLIETILITVVLLLILSSIYLGSSSSEILILISVFGIAAIQLLPSLSRLLQALANIKYGYVALDKIYLELKKFNDYKHNLTTATPIVYKKINFKSSIKLKNISFSYGNKNILNNINLIIPKGKRIALVGKSGGGKSTLLNIILGILVPTQGVLLVDNNIISQENLPSWQNHFGFIPQMIYIYNCTLRENVAFGIDKNEIDDEKVWECLKMASLDNYVNQKCSQGLESLVGENGVKLSGGERQRLGIARAMYQNPDILAMDEATASLDNLTEHLITNSLLESCKGRTLITIAHRVSTIKDYDIIYMVENGSITNFGDFNFLLKNSESFKELLENQ